MRERAVTLFLVLLAAIAALTTSAVAWAAHGLAKAVRSIGVTK